MIILQETGIAQEFKVIPRELVADSMTLTSETTGEAVTYVITPTIEGEAVTYVITPTIDRYYLVINEIVALKENNFYTIEVKNASEIVYKDKIFCTNQTVSDFSVNNNEFTTYSSDNDYITYE
jgi:hypothetical protein